MVEIAWQASAQRLQFEDFKEMRQAGLVDDPNGMIGFVEPDTSIMISVNFHKKQLQACRQTLRYADLHFVPCTFYLLSFISK